jgi:murein DD-endopeptidase MepM/ murein hydrolase activator NlpD
LVHSVQSSLAREPLEPEVQAPPTEAAPLLRLVEHTIQSGETLSVILAEQGIGGVNGILAAARPYFDLGRIRTGRILQFQLLEPEGTPLSFRYPIDEDRSLVVWLGSDEPAAGVEQISYDRVQTGRIIEVETTLWEAALEAGLRPSDIVRLSRIFQWEVDFNTEIREGARFLLVADDLQRSGETVRLDTYYAVRLENAGESHTAIRHLTPEGTEEWYAPDGTATRRPFLRSPLEFSRVTSGFNLRRFHPILRTHRPHRGVDYGAPRGTPVRAVGSGVVVTSGRNGGHGNYVKLDHPGPYHTSYSHLDRIQVRRGQRVQQGDIVGTVGATGLATGPHLHYEFLVSGVHKNPLNVDLPTVRPLPASERPAFAREKAQWLPLLEELAAPTLVQADPGQSK